MNGQTPEKRSTDQQTTDPQDNLQWFHQSLLQAAEQGHIQPGISEDYEIFEEYFKDPQWRNQFHRYLLLEQVDGNIRGVPRDPNKFLDEYAPSERRQEFPLGIDPFEPFMSPRMAKKSDDAARKSTREMDMLDAPGMDEDLIELMRSGEQLEEQAIQRLGESGSGLRDHLSMVDRHRRALFMEANLSGRSMDEDEQHYIDQLSQTHENISEQLFGAYSALQDQLDRVSQAKAELREDEDLPGYAGEGTYARLPKENREAYQALEQRADLIKEQISQLKPKGVDMMRHRVNTFLKSFTSELPAGFFEGVAVLSKDMERMLAAVGNPVNQQPSGFAAKTIYNLLGGDEQRLKEAEQLASWQMAQKIRETANEIFPADPVLAEDFINTTIPAAIGSFGAFATGGVMANAVGASGFRFALGAAATGGMGQAYSEAKQMGASEEEAMLAGNWGFLPGAVQVLPIMRLMQRFDKASGGQLRRGLREVVKEGVTGSFEEALAEMAGQAGFDQIARQIYDEERELLQSMKTIGEAGGAGAIAGFVANIIFGSLGRGISGRITPPAVQEQTDQTVSRETTPEGEPAPETVEVDLTGEETVKGVTFRWDPDASPNDQVSQLDDEAARIRSERDQAAEEGLGTADYDLALEAIGQKRMEISEQVEAPTQQEVEDVGEVTEPVAEVEVADQTTTPPEPLPSLETSPEPTVQPESPPQPTGTSPDQAIQVVDERYSMYRDESGEVHLMREGREVGKTSQYFNQAETEFIAKQQISQPRPPVEQQYSPEIIESSNGYFPEMVDAEGEHLLDFHDAIQQRIDEGLHMTTRGEVENAVIDIVKGKPSKGFTDELTIRLSEKASDIAGRDYTPEFHFQLADQLDQILAGADQQTLNQADDILGREDVDSETWFDSEGNLNYNEALTQLNELADGDPEYEAYAGAELSPQVIQELQDAHEQSITQQIESSETPAGAQQEAADRPAAQQAEDAEQAGEELTDDPQGRQQLTEREAQVRQELNDLISGFDEMASGQLGVGIDPRLVAQSARIIAKAAELGYVRFQQIAGYVIDNFGPEFWTRSFESFRQAFIQRTQKMGNPHGEDLDSLSNMTAQEFVDLHQQEIVSRQEDDSGQATPEQDAPTEIADRPTNDPETIDFFPKIPSVFGRFGLEAYKRTFEGASELLMRTPGLESVGRSIRQYFDTEQAYQGEVARRIDGPLRAGLGRGITDFFYSPMAAIASLKGDNPVEAEFERWAYEWDRGNAATQDQAYLEASPETQDIIDSWIELADYTWQRMNEAGVEVFDASKNAWRAIGKVENFWPRVLKPEYEAAIRDPAKHPEAWAEMVDILISEGRIKSPEQARKYLKTQRSRPHLAQGDYFAGMEMARTEGFPEQMYDHRLSRAIEYLARWSDRQAQIEAFGQKHKDGDVFDKAQKGIVDKTTQDYLNTLQAVIYRSTTPQMTTKAMALLNQVATGIMLGNPATATLNFVGGITLNNIAFGKDSLAALSDMIADGDAMNDALELGIINNDYLRLMHDADGLTPEWLSGSVSGLMRIGGYTPTERLIRLHAFLASSRKLDKAIDRWKEDGFDSKEGKKEAVWFARNGFDPARLVAEAEMGYTRESGRRTGPEIDRFLRYGVNLTQGSYRVDQVPLWAETPTGRFLFKYWKFANQLSRMFNNNHLEPFVKALGTPAGETMQLTDPVTGKERTVTNPRAETLMPILRYFGYSAAGGLILSAAREAIFGYQTPGPEWEELERALQDEDTARAIRLGLQMSLEASISIGGVGIVQYPAIWTRDFRDRRRSYDPTDPAGIAILKETASLGVRAIDQGTITPRNIQDYVDRVFSIVRTTRRAAMIGLNTVGADIDAARLEGARRDVNYARKIARRYARENDIVGPRRSPGAFGATPNTPVNQAITDALLLGQPGKARSILQNHLDSLEDDKQVDAAIRSAQGSIRLRQPLLVSDSPSESERRQVLKWAEENLSESGLNRIKQIDQRYRETAQQVGLMPEEDPRRIRREEVERQTTGPLSEEERRSLYRRRLGWNPITFDNE